MKTISRKILFTIAAHSECSVQMLVDIFNDEQASYVRSTVANLKKLSLVQSVGRGTYTVTPLITGFYSNLMQKLIGISEQKTSYSMFLSQFNSDQVGLKRNFKRLLFDSGFGQLQPGVYIGAYSAPFLLEQVFQSHPELQGAIFYTETPLIQPMESLITNIDSIWKTVDFKQLLSQFNDKQISNVNFFKKLQPSEQIWNLIDVLDNLVEIIKASPAVPIRLLPEQQQMQDIIQREKVLLNDRAKLVPASQFSQIANNLVNTVFKEDKNYAND